ncbi:MAG: glutaminyl-peptide cyclotransferase [Bacteroidota bacterium]
MKQFRKLLVIAFLIGMTFSCGDESDNPNDYFEIQIASQKDGYTTSEQLEVSLQNKKNKSIEKVRYFLDASEVNSSDGTTAQTIALEGQKMGVRKLKAVIDANGKSYEIEKNITMLASKTPELYGYNILETYPHDIKAFTQGLEFENDTLYESTGQRGRSSLRKTNYQNGSVLQMVKVADQFFAEGITILNDKIYQLTWQGNTGFVYDLNSLEKTDSFVYNQSKEGWGLCNNGTTIYKSDGTEKIWQLNPETLAEEGFIEIYTNKSKIPRVNELEWVDGKIYANIWQQDAIAIVDPNSGAVEGVINLKGLQEQVAQHPTLDVLNGIAYNGEPNILYVTGKNWDKLFKIEIVPK